jgi:dihydrofolate synthase/folylpolyglutamate synthase
MRGTVTANPVRPGTLAAWLRYLETLHPKQMALGLPRVRSVYERMGIAPPRPVITVAGTNGKGSVCALMESMLLASAYCPALYTSPHLARYNERVRIGGECASDADLVTAFNAVEDVREAVALTYFEFGTLAALWLFARAKPDMTILEVGLGGRLDAVNIVDADVAVVTSIGIDHVDYLGPTRETIGREKAGVFRPGRPVVCGDYDPPRALIDAADAIGAPVLQIGRDYRATAKSGQWDFDGPGGKRFGLPYPALRATVQVANAATAIAALDLIRGTHPVDAGAIRAGLVEVTLRGRFQVLPGRPAVILDVAHNPDAARVLAATLDATGYRERALAVFGMLADKDIAGVVEAMKRSIDRWFVATLPGPRGAPAQALVDALVAAGVAPAAIRPFGTVAAALVAARGEAGEADKIVVFGSFLTVADAMPAARMQK